MRILALDIGSSAVKAGYFNGRRFTAQHRQPFRTNFDGVRVEAPANRILQALEHAAREVLRSAGPVDALAFCAFSSGVVVTDHRGKVRLGAITHQDRRSAPEAELLVQRLGKQWLLNHTGNLPYPGGIGSSTIAWIARHAPAALRKNCRVGQLSSLIGFMLTGNWTIDPSQAAFLGLLDIRTHAWNTRACRAVGISPDALPKIQWADSILGPLAPRLAKLWSLPTGTPVLGGFVDTDAAVIQTPMHPGQLVHNAGSTDVLALCLKNPRPTEGILTRPLGVGIHFSQRWLAVRTISAAGSALAWARQTLFPTLSDAAWRRTLNKIRRAPDPAPLLCTPNFSGVRAAIDQHIGAAFSGITLSTNRLDLLAAIFHGLVQQSALNYDILAANHRPLPTVYTMGGSTTLGQAMHHAWPTKHTFRQLKSDALPGLVQLTLRTLSVSEGQSRK